MALGNRLLLPNFSPILSLAARLKAHSRSGGLCLAGPALLCGWLLMSAAATASSLQRLDAPPVKQSAATTDIPTEELPADTSSASDVRSPETVVAGTGWSVFASEAGKFRVAMPHTPAAYTFLPKVDLADEQIFGSRLYMQMQLVDATHLEIYTAAFIASTRFTETSRDATEALLGCVTGLSDSDPVMPPQAIALGDYPGIEAEFLTAEGSLQVSRCYLAGDRAYLLTATNELFTAGAGLQPVTWGSSLPVRSPEMNTFFSSFEILP